MTGAPARPPWPDQDIVAEPGGVIYNGTVVKTVDFGAFVNFLGARTVLSISPAAERPDRRDDRHLQEGDKVKVKIIGFDDRGKVKLSMKRVDQRRAPISRPRPPKNRPGTEHRNRKTRAVSAARFFMLEFSCPNGARSVVRLRQLRPR